MKGKPHKKTKKMVAKNNNLNGELKISDNSQKSEKQIESNNIESGSSSNENQFKMKATEASDKAFEEKPLTEEEMINSEDYVFCYVDGVMHFIKLPESEE